MKLKCSDVATFTSGTMELYQAYGVTWVTWGGHPTSRRVSQKEQETFNLLFSGSIIKKVKDAHDAGVHYCNNIGMLHEFAGMVDFDPNFMDSVALDLQGKPRSCPWMWDWIYKGYPAYIFCANSPSFQTYLRFLVELFVKAGVDGTHIDDALLVGPSCYCNRCISLFKRYLKDSHPDILQQVLKKAGIKDVNQLTKEIMIEHSLLLSGNNWPGLRGITEFPPDKFSDKVQSFKLDRKQYTPLSISGKLQTFNFREIFKNKKVLQMGWPIAYIFRELYSPKVQKIKLGFGADWEVRWLVNGKTVLDNNLTSGNKKAIKTDNHTVILPLKRGINLIGTRLTSGTGGWLLALGKLPEDKGLSWKGNWQVLGPIENRMAMSFYDQFQLESVERNVRMMHDYVQRLAGKPIPVSSNSFPHDYNCRFVSQSVEFLSAEIPVGADTNQCSKSAVLEYKLADALGKMLCSMGTGTDHAHIKAEQRHGLVKTWIAESYAFGGLFMCPFTLWCYTVEKGTHYYKGPTKQFAPLYQFVRYNAELFDDYEPVEKVGLLYDYKTNRLDSRVIGEIAYQLAQANIPFKIVITGMNGKDTVQDCKGLENVIATDVLSLSKSPKKNLYTQIPRRKVIQWKNIKEALPKLPQPIHIDGAKNVWILPRVKPDNQKAPVVIHLLNRNYNSSVDSMEIRKNFRVCIEPSLLNIGEIREIKLLSPEKPDVKLKWELNREMLSIQVPELNLWSLVVIYLK